MTRDHTRKIDIETRLRRELIRETSDWVHLLKTNKLDGTFSMSTSSNAGDLPVLLSGRYDPIAQLLEFSELLEPAVLLPLAVELEILGYRPGYRPNPTEPTGFMDGIIPLMVQLGQSMAALDFKQVQILLAQHAREFLIDRARARFLQQQLDMLELHGSDHVLASKAETELNKLIHLIGLVLRGKLELSDLKRTLIECYPLQAAELD